MTPRKKTVTPEAPTSVKIVNDKPFIEVQDNANYCTSKVKNEDGDLVVFTDYDGLLLRQEGDHMIFLHPTKGYRLRIEASDVKPLLKAMNELFA